MKRLYIYLTDEEVFMIRQQAVLTNRSKAQVVRDALDVGLGEDPLVKSISKASANKLLQLANEVQEILR